MQQTARSGEKAPLFGGRKPLFTQSQLLKLTWPLLVEQFLAVTVGMADTMMVSRCGEAPAPCCKESSLHARRGCLPPVLGLFVSLPGTFHQICAFLQKCDFPCVLFKKFKNPLVIFRQTWYVVSNKGISLDTNVHIFYHPAFVP